VILPKDGATADELTKNADLALYRAKESGRGRFAFFEPAMSDGMQERIRLASDLHTTLAAGEGLEAWLQPQIDLSGDRVVGFEALLRWRHPTRGLVPPSEFIPIAESSSLISDVGHWVMLESARMAKNWIDEGRQPYEIAVNLSAAQIWQSDIVSDLTAILEETGLPPHLLCMELTESMLADHSEGRVRHTLTALKALGVRLALDDFGTGYSSLGYLVQLPFDKLKIDRLFIDGAARSEKMQHVLRGIVALGHGLGMTVVAEGVEQPDDLA
jgi:EAL domain-containing protein (putative c-di-GMP-specific phosphodiesterase class I)